MAGVVDQGDAVRIAVLQTGDGNRQHTVAAARGAKGYGKCRCRRVRRTVGAVVRHDFPSGQIGARRTGDLDAFVEIGTRVVVMDFVDEDRGVGNGNVRASQQNSDGAARQICKTHQ